MQLSLNVCVLSLCLFYSCFLVVCNWFIYFLAECFRIENQLDALEEGNRPMWLSLKQRLALSVAHYLNHCIFVEFPNQIFMVFLKGFSITSWKFFFAGATNWHKPQVQWSSCWQQSFESWCWNIKSQGKWFFREAFNVFLCGFSCSP